MEVAIKEASSEEAQTEMLDEAKAMIKVSKHDHIVNIQGISVYESCVYLLLEFCSNGAIEDYLQKNQKEFTKKLRDNTSKEIICWSKQVADAMGFLAKKDIIHVSFFLSDSNFTYLFRIK